MMQKKTIFTSLQLYEYISQAEEARDDPTTEPKHEHIGKRVKVKGKGEGVLRFIGPKEGSDDDQVFCGVHLDDAIPDSSHDGG